MPTPDKRHEVVIVRHGATEWSRNGRHTGSTDLSLLPSGQTQAKSLVPLLSHRSFSLVLVSPLKRAVETCDLLGFGRQSQTNADLHEWDYGDYEGLTTDEIHETDPEWTVWDGAIPNGETIDQVAERADRVIELARRIPGEVLLVSHGHFLRVLMARWCDLDPRTGRHLLLDTGTVNVLSYEHGYPAIDVLNQR